MLTQEYLKSLFHFDSETGLFFRLVSRNRKYKVGDIAGTKSFHGYIHLTIDGKVYKAHRLAWFYVHGYWPKEQIDHINGIKDDNRLCNLRKVTNAQNMQNRSQSNPNSKIGIKGIDFRKNKYRVRIGVNYKSIFIGEFKNLEDAKTALKEALIKYHPFNKFVEEK